MKPDQLGVVEGNDTESPVIHSTGMVARFFIQQCCLSALPGIPRTKTEHRQCSARAVVMGALSNIEM